MATFWIIILCQVVSLISVGLAAAEKRVYAFEVTFFTWMIVWFGAALWAAVENGIARQGTWLPAQALVATTLSLALAFIARGIRLNWKKN